MKINEPIQENFGSLTEKQNYYIELMSELQNEYNIEADNLVKLYMKKINKLKKLNKQCISDIIEENRNKLFNKIT